MAQMKTYAIRLARHGCTNRPFFQIVVMEKHRASQGLVTEQLGTYDPMPNKRNEVLVGFNFERIKYWVARGAVPSKQVDVLLGLSGFYPIHPMTHTGAQRNRQKALEELQAAELKKQEEELEKDSVSDSASGSNAAS